MKKKFYLYRAHAKADYVMFPITDQTPKLSGMRADNPQSEYIGPFEAPPLPTFKNAFLWKWKRLQDWFEMRRIKREAEKNIRRWQK